MDVALQCFFFGGGAADPLRMIVWCRALGDTRIQLLIGTTRFQETSI